MTDNQTTLRLHTVDEQQTLDVELERLIVAGYTARDEQAVVQHIAELAAIGVPEPASVPAFYELEAKRLTTEPVVEIDGTATSGEVEPVLVRHRGSYYLGVGSDHTDREIERRDIAASKAACAKPVGPWIVPLADELSAVDWDNIAVSCTADDYRYQDGTLAALRTPANLLTRLTDVCGDTGGDLVVFGGTLPLLTGEFLYGTRWHLDLRLADGRAISHYYETKQRSV